MLRSLHIQNFRALREFRMSGLGRVNLLVGTNNCGKTSVLEAIHILAAAGQSIALWDALRRRGETSEEQRVDVAHLFHGHDLGAGRSFSIASDGDRVRSFRAVVSPAESSTVVDGEVAEQPLQLDLQWIAANGATMRTMPRALDEAGRVKTVPGAGAKLRERDAVRFLSEKGLSRTSAVQLLERVLLTPDEAVVMGALRSIEPAIERIASVNSGGKRPNVVIMIGGRRVPIGSMGGGIWRLLGIALALSRVPGGVLLVDEIDTGLHYTVLEKMWKLVFDTATRLDVQVFATTHSRDCVEAMAAISQPGRHEISIQRIERHKPEAVAISEDGIPYVAERGIEVR